MICKSLGKWKTTLHSSLVHPMLVKVMRDTRMCLNQAISFKLENFRNVKNHKSKKKTGDFQMGKTPMGHEIS